MRHVYLSPHLDDAVLSCGGAIHRQVTTGESVWVITVFAADVASGTALSPFAEEQHQYWFGHPRPFALRRAEDLGALTLLEAEASYLDYIDAVYRTAADGQWLYTDPMTLCGNLQLEDPLAGEGTQHLAERLATLIQWDSQSVVYAPLAVGRHVDHQIVHAAARELLTRGYRLAFYEDYPYAEQPGALENALAQAQAMEWRMAVIPLDAADLIAKVRALGYYQSQMAVLFGGLQAMPSRVWAFASTRSTVTGLAERIWWPLPHPDNPQPAAG